MADYMSTEEFLEKIADPEFRKAFKGDPVIESWEGKSPSDIVLEYARVLLNGEPEAWARIERQRFINSYSVA